MSTLDKIIHDHSRLRILTYLASSNKTEVSFNELKEKLEFTSGNLSIQLKKLKDVEYISIEKTFKENKSHTTLNISKKGLTALNSYIEEMEKIIQTLKNNQK